MMNIQRVLFISGALVLGLVSAAVAAIPPLQAGKAYTFDGYLVVRSCESARAISVWLAAFPNGETPRGLAGRQDLELAPTKAMPAKALTSLARSVGGDKKVTVKGHGGAKGVLKVDEITPVLPRVEPRPRPQPQPRPIRPTLTAEVQDAKLERNTLILTVMASPCTSQADLKVKASAVAETDPGQASVSVTYPDNGPCMLAVMPSPMTVKVDLAKQFPGARRLALTIESRHGEGFAVDWEKR